MNIKQLNEELQKFIIQERDRTFDNYDYDDLEEIVRSEYGASYYIMTIDDECRVYEKDGEIYKIGSFDSYEDAIDCICHCFDGDDITEVYDNGDIKFYDSDVEKYALEHAYFDQKDDEEVTEKTFAKWFGKDLTGQTYEGDIYCEKKGLTSLKGAPKKVTGTFWCNMNKLTTLEGCPEEVGGCFDCGDNNLTSLKGAPQEVGENFECYRNNLINLEGAPKQINGTFTCSENNLTTLEGAPQEVGENFYCGYNNLTTLKFAPKEVGHYFDCSFNSLISLEGAPKQVGGWFDCRYNGNLKSLDGIGEVKGTIYSDIKE